jgi:hypothetical protein
VEGAQDEVEAAQEVGIHVALAGRGEVHLDRAEDPEAGCGEPLVCLVDLDALSKERGLVHPAGDREAYGVVGDGDVFVSERRGPTGHLIERRGPVAPGRVHLEVAAETRRVGFGGQDLSRFRPGHEAAAELGRTGDRRGFLEPFRETPGHPRSHRPEV